jgi:hypothetical protein
MMPNTSPNKIKAKQKREKRIISVQYILAITNPYVLLVGRLSGDNIYTERADLILGGEAAIDGLVGDAAGHHERCDSEDGKSNLP